MLEKHLAHLKKSVPHIDGMAAPQPLATTRQVLKEEESPAKSPATASNWNSPNQVPGVSPVGSNVTDEYMQQMQQHAGPYAVNPMQSNMGYSTSPQIPMPGRPPPPPGHRRQISDISGGDDLNNPAKRQQMYQTPLQPPMHPMQRPPQ